MSNLTFESLWIEKYRPRSLDEIVLKPAIKQLIKDYATKEEIPNLLFAGNTGIGKSSLAKIIASDVLKCQFLYINASDENGIETVRGKIKSFAQTRSIDGKIKVILLDEVDGFSSSGQEALRNLMEEYARFTRFILTANHVHRITHAIQSRCQHIHVETSVVDVVKRCSFILKQEGIKISADQTSQLIETVKKLFPDIRRIVNALQRMCSSGTLKFEEVAHSKVASELFTLLRQKSSCETVRQFVINHEEEFSGDYPALLKSLLTEVYDSEIDEKNKQIIICIIAEHLYRCSFVMDQEINSFHCLISIITSIA